MLHLTSVGTMFYLYMVSLVLDKKLNMQVVSAIMKNYEHSVDNEESDATDDAYQYWANEVSKGGGRVPMSTLTDAFVKLPSQKEGFVFGYMISLLEEF